MTITDGILLWALVTVGIVVAHHRAKVWDKQLRRGPETLDLTGRRW